MEEIFLGVIDDPRSEEEKAKDYPSEEILGMGTVTWQEKPESEWIKLSLRDQVQSFSCGSHAGAKAFEAFTGLVMSAHPVYRQRKNFPAGGMYGQDIGDILKKNGTTLEIEDKSNLCNEEEMNRDITVETPYKIGGYYFLRYGNTIDMDTIGAALEAGHPVIFGIASTHQEWNDCPVPTAPETNFRHFVTAIPGNHLLYKGEKAVVIDDSWGHATTLGSGGQRILTESFLKKRSWHAMALIPRKLEDSKPKFDVTRNMRAGYFGEDVKKLQACLAYLNYFPKTQVFTGYFGTITKNAVIKFQTAHDLLPDGIVGPITRAKLAGLFS